MENTSDKNIEELLKNPVICNIYKFLENKGTPNFLEYLYKKIRNQNNRVEYQTINEIEFKKLIPLVTAVILTANKIECDMLNYILSPKKNSVLKRLEAGSNIATMHFFCPEIYVVRINSFYFLHMRASETGSVTPGGSQDLVRMISSIDNLKPSCIISFGICYGIDPRTQNIGDVIIPNRIYPWSLGQKIEDNSDNLKIKIKSDKYILSLETMWEETNIYKYLNQYCNGEDGKKINRLIPVSKKNKYSLNYKISCGNINSGEAVISSKHAKEVIANASYIINAIAGEMEGYGMAKECFYYANIPCFIIKGICDWGDIKDIDGPINIILKKKYNYSINELKDKLQAYAAYCAGDALLALLLCDDQRIYRYGLWDKIVNSDLVKTINVSELKKHIKEYYEIDDAEEIFETLIKNNYVNRTEKRDILEIKYTL